MEVFSVLLRHTHRSYLKHVAYTFKVTYNATLDTCVVDEIMSHWIIISGGYSF
jgi:hypothetical protein